MRIIRVFPRKTNATPTDDLAVVNRPPNLADSADEVHVSVTFVSDLGKAETLARQWRFVAPVKVGGPAYNDIGGQFSPGLYVKQGYVTTSRGCPNRCWFCQAWKNEGGIRELEIKDGWNLLDNNIFACTQKHQQAVFEMLSRQGRRPRFTGGLEAAKLTTWHVEWLQKLKPETAYFAYDMKEDYYALAEAAELLRTYGLLRRHIIGCYVLVGYKGDTFSDAEGRLIATIKMGYFPQAMLYNRGENIQGEIEKKQWRRFQREWANKVIVGSKMREYA